MRLITKRRLILVIILLTLLIAAAVFTSLRQAKYTAQLLIEATPLSSTITLNGHGRRQGTIRLTPGLAKIHINHEGFESYDQQVTIKAGETKYVGVILKSNSPSTANWYSQHPEDQKMLERIQSKSFNRLSSRQLQLEPFIKKLPFVAAGFEFKVDYGQVPGTDKPTIYIQADTQEAHDDSLAWIQHQGYDPSKMNIVFTLSPRLSDGD